MTVVYLDLHRAMKHNEKAREILERHYCESCRAADAFRLLLTGEIQCSRCGVLCAFLHALGPSVPA
jgi:ribosomal protein L37AE/L43A